MSSRSRTYTYYYPVKPKGLRFGKTELTHILIAVLVLTIAFALAFSDFMFNYEVFAQDLSLFVPYILAAFIAVGTGFLLHEVAHKLVAQRYGCWAEFRYDRMGLVLALVTGFIGIVFAAPGAVFVAGKINKEQNGKISLAGPMTNVLLALFFIVVGTLQPPLVSLMTSKGYILTFGTHPMF